MASLEKGLIRFVLAALLSASGTGAHAAVITQLGFLVDGSGSISAADFNTMRTGYAAAFSGLPVDGSVELTLVQFGSTTVGAGTAVTTTVINNLVIDSVAARALAVAQVTAMLQIGGATPMAAGIDAMRQELVTSANFSLGIASLINMATDGQPTFPAPDSLARSLTVSAAAAADAAGIDALTVEAIGTGVDLAFLRSIVFSPLGGAGTGVVLPLNSTPPNPMTSRAWVLPVNSFDDFPTAIRNKVQAVVVSTPEPGSIALIALGLAAFGFSRRRRS